MKIPTKRKIINAFLEENYLGKNIKVYVGRGIQGGIVQTGDVEPKYFYQVTTNEKEFNTRITNSEEHIVKIIKIEWEGGLTYCATFDPIIYKDHTFTEVYIHGEFQLV